MNALKIILAIQIFSAIVALGAIVYMAIRRSRRKDKEFFEKRDN
ncbi:MAG: hypothetical protein RBT19_14335 [Tenuifilaceae bacterium]|jgi:hypothetical protein|nr:hypothetical protein [Perlabentimonas gracilis]MDX9771536.1 hypothetical protein [Tenuifilaceae bacterium]